MATLNPNIILGVQRPRTISPQEMYAQKAQFDQNELAQRMGQMKMQEYERGVQEQNQLKDVYRQFGKDAEQNVNSLYKAGLGKQAQEYSKAQGDLAKDKAGTNKTNIEGLQKVVGLMGSTAYALSQSPTLNIQEVAGAVEQLKSQLPQEYHAALDVSKLPQDPQGLRAALQGIYTKSIETDKLLSDQTSRRNNDQTTNASIENNKRSVGASYANAAATRDVAQSNRDAARIQTGFNNEQGLRKEFESLPEVKNYKQAYPAYAAIKDATGRNTTQSDINIVYGLAKLYDPTSVVREGEYATVANSPNIPEKVKGYAQYLAGGGRLSPETKKQILAEAQGRIGTYETEAKKAKTSYEGIAKKRGMDPASVFADMGDMTANPTAPAPNATPAAIPQGWKVQAR